MADCVHNVRKLRHALNRGTEVEIILYLLVEASAPNFQLMNSHHQFTPEIKKAISNSRQEAERLGHAFV
ncbi:MAG: hypothetical protein AAFY91_15740, partial [Bacteroidota bacterium]